MSCSFSLHVPKALPLLPSSSRGIASLFIASKHKPSHNNNTPSQSLHHILKCSCSQKPNDDVISLKKPRLTPHIGAVLLALAEHPALAVTGENNPQELTWVLTQLGIVLFFYFLVAPPIIMYWLWKRWYRRKLAEMYFQFMFVFIFFPAIIVWAPFLNFRKFPRDPSLQYPWSIPEDPSKIRNAYSKYPFAEPEDYDRQINVLKTESDIELTKPPSHASTTFNCSNRDETAVDRCHSARRRRAVRGGGAHSSCKAQEKQSEAQVPQRLCYPTQVIQAMNRPRGAEEILEALVWHASPCDCM